MAPAPLGKNKVHFTACQSEFDSNEYHMLLLKNPQFSSNHYKTLSKYGTAIRASF